jgi:hypothetical protein
MQLMAKVTPAMIHSKERRFGRQAFIGMLLLAASGVVSPARADAPAPALDVTAKLVDIPSTPPPDDLYDYAYVMKYVVQGGPLDGKPVLVAHYKPLTSRAKIKDKRVGGKLRAFKVGDVHKLKLSSELKAIWKGPLVDEYAATDRNSVRYWCFQADPA